MARSRQGGPVDVIWKICCLSASDRCFLLPFAARSFCCCYLAGFFHTIIDLHTHSQANPPVVDGWWCVKAILCICTNVCAKYIIYNNCAISRHFTPPAGGGTGLGEASSRMKNHKSNNNNGNTKHTHTKPLLLLHSTSETHTHMPTLIFCYTKYEKRIGIAPGRSNAAESSLENQMKRGDVVSQTW